MKKILCVGMVSVFIFSTTMQAFAASGPDFWVGSDSVDVSDPLNWSLASANEPPQSGDSLVYDAAGTAGADLIYDVASSTITGITFNADASAFNVAGSGSNIMTLTGAVANNSNNDQTLGMEIGGEIDNTGTGAGAVTFSGPVTSTVTTIAQDSTSSPLFITGGITVNAGGTTVNDNSGTLTISGGVTGAGDFTLQNNTSTDNALSVTTDSIDNAGRIVNSGTGTGAVLISGGVGTDVTNIVEDSSTSNLSVTTDPITVGAGGLIFNDNLGSMTVTSGITGSGSLVLFNNTAVNDAISITTNSVDVSSTIMNGGGGTGESLISGGIGSNVTGVTENSATSALTVSTNPISVNSSGTTLNDTAGTFTVSGGVSGTGNLFLQNDTSTDDALSLTTSSVNNSGIIDNTGTGSGEALISGGIGSNVTGVAQDSATSALMVSTDAISVNSSSTTLADNAGTFTVSGGVTGTGNLILNNDSGTDNALSFTTSSINNSGTIINSGTSGATEISGGVGSSVTGITENSAASALTIDTSAISVNGSGTTLTDTLGALTVSGGVTGSGDLLLNNNSTTAGGITLSTTSVNNTGAVTNSGTGTGSTLISAQIGSDVTNVIEDSVNSPLVLSNVTNNYSGPTRVMAGTLQTAAANVIPVTSDVSITGGATLDLDGNSQEIGSLRGAGTVTNTAVGSPNFTVGADNSSTTFSGVIEDGSGGGTTELIKEGSGTLTLSGPNTYSAGTDISAGTVVVGNAGALGSGAVLNGATLNIGAVNLTVGGYIQDTATLDLTVNSASSYGKITAPGGANLNAANTFNVTVESRIPTGTTFTIIDTEGAGVSTSGGYDPTVTSSNPDTSFTSSIVDNDLIFTADSLASFTSLGNNRNAQALGSVLDNMTSPSTDMTNVLNALNSSTNAQITSALNTMGPVMDGGIIQDTSASLNNLISTTLDRIQNQLNQSYSGSFPTGVSSGDDIGGQNGIWARPYGSYLVQGTMQGIQGYDAWNAGTVIGLDRMITDSFTLGISGGYAYGQVDSDANNATADINSAQGTLYAGYKDPTLNYFVDAAGSFAWNWYDGRRDITIDTTTRTADSDYDGQQYGAYLDGGYKFNLGESLQLTPLVSVQWTHLTLPSYTETSAGSLDLNVGKQNYNDLESGLGASIAYPIQFNWGNVTPELHAKWLYDYIGDRMVVTSSFTGGGGSFTSYGANPSKQGSNVGGKLSFNLNNDLSIIAAVDTEFKDQFFSVYGSGTVRYKF